MAKTISEGSAANPYSAIGSHAIRSDWAVTPDTWKQGAIALNELKHLIKVNSEAHTIDSAALKYPLLQSNITEEQYRTLGMDNLSVYNDELTKLEIELEEQTKPATGKIFKREINKSDFLVNNISIL